MKHKYRKEKLFGVSVAIKNEKWQVPMKPRLLGTIAHKDLTQFDRNRNKIELRKMTESY